MLWLFIEGPYDQYFFEHLYQDKYQNSVQFYQYAKKPKEKINNFIRSIRCMPDCSYLFICDSDGKTDERLVGNILAEYNSVTANHIVIVRYEIEGWYYSGVTLEFCREKKIRNFEFMTDKITKEDFEFKLPRRSSKQIILLQMLENYSVELATQRNRSLNNYYNSYFV